MKLSFFFIFICTSLMMILTTKQAGILEGRVSQLADDIIVYIFSKLRV